jgi:hypothetical protein
MTRAVAISIVAIVLLLACISSSVPLFWYGLFWEASINGVYFDALETEEPKARYVADFVRLFPDCTVSYVYFGGNKYPGFNATVVLKDRYVLRMLVPVTISYSEKKVINYGEPDFYLHEAKQVQEREISYDARGQLIFGLTEWQKIVANNGDFEAIGYTMKTDMPVPGLKELIRQSNRNNRR